MTAATVSSTKSATSPTRLPALALIGLFFAGFVGILTEALPAGLLPQIGQNLGVSTAGAGQTVTIYAIGTAVASIPLTRATAGWNRKSVLLVAMVALVVANVLTAASPDYVLTLVIRFVAGLATGLIWTQLGGYGSRLAPKGKEGLAVTIAMAGVPVSLALGVPLGTLVGQALSWQAVFYLTGALTILTIAWMLLTLPRLPGQRTHASISAGRAFVIPGVRTILFVVTAFIVAHNILYTYIASFLQTVGMEKQVGYVLFVFGALAIVSIALVGRFIDGHLLKLVLISIALFALAVLVLALFTQSPALVYLSAGAWGLAFGSSSTLFITAGILVGGPNAEVVASVVITFFASSIALGGIIGGILVSVLGAGSLAWVTLFLLVAAGIVSILGRRHAFPSNR